VEVSDGATVLLTGKGEVIALHQYAVKKLGARQHGIEKIQARAADGGLISRSQYIEDYDWLICGHR
jgi:hypothetical protein